MLLFSMVENEKDLSKFQRIYDQYKNMMYWVAYDITRTHMTRKTWYSFL